MKKILSLGVFMAFISLNISAQVVAAFSADVTQGCDLLTVQFTDESIPIGEIVTWEWDLGDGTISNVQNFTHDYAVSGEYSVCLTVENSLGEMDTHCETNYISVLESPIADAGPDVVLTCVNASATIDASASSSGPNISYEWIDPTGSVIGDSLTVDIFISGIYTLIVRNLGVCISMDEVNVLEDVTGPIVTITPGPFCSFPYVLSAIGSSTGPEFIYEWFNENLEVIGTEIEIEITEFGDYTLEITNIQNGCYSAQTYSVNDPGVDLLEISGVVENVSCFGSADGSIDLTVTGGEPVYTFSWSNANAATTEDINGLVYGTYSVTVTDDAGCSTAADFIVEEAAELILFYNIECPTGTSDGSVDLVVSGGTAPYLYEWSNGVILEDIDNLFFGIYEITVTDVNGCTVTGSVEIGTTIEQLVGGDMTYCENDQVQLEVIAPNAISYEWSAGNLSCYDCPNPIATVGLAEETFYSVTVTEADGCIDVGFINFDVQSYLDFNLLEFSNSPVYAGQDIVFDCNVSNANSVEWTGPNSFQSFDCNAVVSNANSGSEGEYILDIVDQNGCVANASTDVLVYDIIEFISNDTIICQGESVQLEVIASSAVSITWTPSVALDDPSSATPFAMPGSTTIYTVTVEDVNGFMESASVLVEIVEFPVLVNNGPITVCEGGSALLCGDPGNLPGDYLWTWPSGSSTEACIDITPLEGECFTLNYTAPNGCFFEDEICFDIIEEIIVDDFYSDTICRAGSTVLDVDIVGPLTISYEWTPAEFLDCTTCENPIASVLETTVFSVTVTEANGCTDEATVEVVVDQGCVWPGDTDSSYVVNNFDLLNIGLAFDSIGPTRSNASLSWVPQPADSWTQSTPDGVNYKFIDCDGNGVINSDDTLGITQNWGAMHNFTGDDDVQFFGPNYPQSGLTVTVPFYVEPDTLIENESYALPIILGESGNEAEDIYGLAFTLEYDSAVIVPGSASIGFDGWLGTLNNDMIAIQKTFNSPGRVDVGITRIDGLPMNGFGQMGTLYITIEDDVLLRMENDSRDDDAIEINFNITNVLVINNLGQEIPVVPMETSMLLEETVGTNDINWDEYIQIAPNPVDDVLYLTTKNIEIETVKLFSITGALLLESTIESSSTEINTSHLNPGLYMLEVRTDLGVMVERVVVGR